MIGYERSIPERFSYSQAATGGGSPHFVNIYLHKKIVQKFKNNVSQCTTAKKKCGKCILIGGPLYHQKDFEDLGKPLHISSKAENRH